jgi:hypothetical protein
MCSVRELCLFGVALTLHVCNYTQALWTDRKGLVKRAPRFSAGVNTAWLSLLEIHEFKSVCWVGTDHTRPCLVFGS